MALHQSSRMHPDAHADVSIKLYWNTRAKRWDVVVSGKNGTRSWSVTRLADSTADISQSGGWALANAVVAEIESWLF